MFNGHRFGPCVLWICPHHPLNLPLLSGKRCSRLILYFPYLSPGIGHSPGSDESSWLLDIPFSILPCFLNLPLTIPEIPISFLSPPSIHTFLSGLRYSHDFWISIPISSSNCQTCICNCPLDISNPMSHRHLKLNRLKLNLFTLPPSQT